MDGRLLVGDEITHINFHSVVDASHRDVISLMGQAAAHGEVVLGIKRKIPMPETLSPTSGVAQQGRFEPQKQDLGLLPQQQLPPEEEGGDEIPKGERTVVVERPNEQTSFGFVLQSNTLRAGCIICE